MAVDSISWLSDVPPDALAQSTLKQSIEALLRRALVSGDMRPGEIYSANSIASQLKVSNSPVREAMMALANAGLLEQLRNRGFRVIEMTEDDKREIYELRLQIEVEAVRRITERGITEEQAKFIADLSQQTVDLVDAPLVDYLEADQQFHLGLVSLINNKRWLNIVKEVRDQSRANGHYACLKDSDHLTNSAEEHQRITQAVIRGDADLAAALMVQHLEYARPNSM